MQAASMKILHIYKTAYPLTYGGIEQMIHQLALGCSEAGVDVRVLCLSDKEAGSQVINDKYKIVYVKKHAEIASMGLSFDYLKKYKELARESDIIHYHFPWPFMDLMHLISHVKKPFIVTYHSDIVRQKYLNFIYQPLMHLFLKSTYEIVCTSYNYLNTSDVLQRYTSKTSVVPIGLEDKYNETIDQIIVDKWNNRIGSKFVLFIGSIRNYKGINNLIDAAKFVNGLILIAGSGKNLDKIQSILIKNNINNIKLLGKVSEEDKYCLISLCEAVVLPSNKRSEAFGLVLIEGSMFGKPLISCDIGTGTSYANIHGETGIIVPPNDCRQLAAAINLIIQNKSYSDILGVNSRHRYLKLFTSKKMSIEYLNIYKRVFNS